jgi:hypothetical protein
MAATAAILTVSGTALAQAPQSNMQGSAEALAHAAQNTIAVMISLPFHNNVVSAGGDGRNRYKTLTIQPFVNDNFLESPGTYLSFSPLVTANCEARSGQQWTVPVSLTLGQILRLGQHPVNAQSGAYRNAIRPDVGPEWQLRLQI